jgi:hypothetical protein
MSELQVQLVVAWLTATDAIRVRVDRTRQRDAGEVTATTALIVILVIAAIAAATIIATKITNNANNVPEP